MQLTPFLRSVKASREHFARCFACSNWDAPAYAENPAQIKSIKPIQIIISISPIKTLPFHAQSVQALGKGSNIHVEHDACHIFVECALHVDRRIVNKDAFLRAKGELAQEGAVDLRVGLQQLDLCGDQGTVHQLAGPCPCPVDGLTGGSVGKQVEPVALCFQCLQKLQHSLYRHNGVIPFFDQPTGCIVQTLRQAGQDALLCDLLVDDAPVQHGPLHRAEHLVAASDFLPFYLSRIDRFGSTPETLRLDCPEMQAAMRQYHALEKFSCKQNWWGDSIQKFAEGKTAMTVIYSNYAAELINSGNSVVVGRVGAAILPGCKPLLGGGIVGISRYSQKAEACKQFFHWYYSADVASLLVRLGGTSPIVDAYEDFQNYSIFPWMNTSKKSFGLGQRGVINQTPERFSIPKYEFAVGTAVRNVVQDLMTPEDASRMAQALYDAADPVCR